MRPGLDTPRAEETARGYSTADKTTPLQSCRIAHTINGYGRRSIVDGPSSMVNPSPKWGGVGEGFFSRFPQRLIQVPEDVFDVLDPDREADEIGRHAGRGLLFG